MSNKYVIRNCPAILPMTKLCDSENLNKPNTYCQDCTNCVMKQIVELCKGSIRENERNIYRAGRMSLAINILGLLDIEEVANEVK